jgi:hypothetical protein
MIDEKQVKSRRKKPQTEDERTFTDFVKHS